jgi:hypothetical protein
VFLHSHIKKLYLVDLFMILILPVHVIFGDDSIISRRIILNIFYIYFIIVLLILYPSVRGGPLEKGLRRGVDFQLARIFCERLVLEFFAEF